MTHENAAARLTELNDILDTEREALLAGNLEELTNLLAPKEELMALIGDVLVTDTTLMEEMNRKLRRNQLLLDGALDGIRTVASRLAKLREAKGSLETYGADGKRRDLSVGPESSVERRA